MDWEKLLNVSVQNLDKLANVNLIPDFSVSGSYTRQPGLLVSPSRRTTRSAAQFLSICRFPVCGIAAKSKPHAQRALRLACQRWRRLCAGINVNAEKALYRMRFSNGDAILTLSRARPRPAASFPSIAVLISRNRARALSADCCSFGSTNAAVFNRSHEGGSSQNRNNLAFQSIRYRPNASTCFSRSSANACSIGAR